MQTKIINNSKNNIELLCPAGDIENFKAAISAGADAIYMGINKFNARQMAKNFELEEYIDCILYAHLRGVKVYLTLNVLLYDDEIKEAINIISMLYSKGLDAVIVQDLGLAKLIHKLIPKLPLHASTQMSIYSLEQVNVLKKLGFKRVVLARELTLDEIENICKNTDIEIEVFIHGALCMSYSGQCLISYFIGRRSANRGNCAQVCRMRYSLYSKSNNKSIVSNRYLLSKKDIFGLNYIQKLKNIGVTSLKIEGRNKTKEYVAGVTSIYRKYIDNIESNNKNYILNYENDKKILLQLFNRNGMSNGYLDGNEYKEGITELSPKNTGLYLGKVISQKGKYVKVTLQEDIDLHDGIEIYYGDNVFSNIVTCIRNNDFELLNKKVGAKNTVWIGDISKKVVIGSDIYKTSSSYLNNDIKSKYLLNKNSRKKVYDVSVIIKNNTNIKVTIDNTSISYILDYIPQASKNKYVTNEDIEIAFSKTQDTPFVFKNINIILDNNLFVPISKLNELRRGLINELIKSFEIDRKIDISKKIDEEFNNVYMENKVNKPLHLNSLYVYKYNGKINYLDNNNLNIIYFSIVDYIKNKEEINKKYINKVDVYLNIPNIVGKNVSDNIYNNIENYIKDGIKGFLIGSLTYIDILNKMKKKYDIKIVSDYTLNVSNVFSAKLLKDLGVDIITMSVEADENSINSISKIFKIEIVKDLVTVVTSRYCVLGSYISNRLKNTKCKYPCLKDNYYLIDSYGYKYDIICDEIDCIMRLVRKFEESVNISDDEIYSIRKCII